MNIDSLIGFFPQLEPHIKDPKAFAIHIHSPTRASINSVGKLTPVVLNYKTSHELRKEMKAFLDHNQIKISKLPIQCRFQDGTLLSFSDSPISPSPQLSIEMPFKYPVVTIDHFLNWGAVSKTAIQFLKDSIQNGLSVMVCSNEQVSLTSFLIALTRFTSRNEWVAAVNFDRPIFGENRHISYIQTVSPFDPRHPEIPMDKLLPFVKDMGADRIILSHLDSPFLFPYFNLIHQGLKGITGQLAQNPQELLQYLKTGLASHFQSNQLALQLLSSTLDIVVSINKHPDGKRRVDEIVEIQFLGENDLHLETIFKRQEDHSKSAPSLEANDPHPTSLKPTEAIPKCLVQLQKLGSKLNEKSFSLP